MGLLAGDGVGLVGSALRADVHDVSALADVLALAEVVDVRHALARLTLENENGSRR